MKYKLLQIKQWVISTIMRWFNIYPYMVEHEGEGMYDYNEGMFKEEKSRLTKILRRMRRAGIRPNINDSLYGSDGIYYIKSICYYETHCSFWVDEEETRDD